MNVLLCSTHIEMTYVVLNTCRLEKCCYASTYQADTNINLNKAKALFSAKPRTTVILIVLVLSIFPTWLSAIPCQMSSDNLDGSNVPCHGNLGDRGCLHCQTCDDLMSMGDCADMELMVSINSVNNLPILPEGGDGIIQNQLPLIVASAFFLPLTTAPPINGIETNFLPIYLSTHRLRL